MVSTSVIFMGDVLLCWCVYNGRLVHRVKEGFPYRPVPRHCGMVLSRNPVFINWRCAFVGDGIDKRYAGHSQAGFLGFATITVRNCPCVCPKIWLYVKGKLKTKRPVKITKRVRFKSPKASLSQHNKAQVYVISNYRTSKSHARIFPNRLEYLQYLLQVGWIVQNYKSINMGASIGI